MVMLNWDLNDLDLVFSVCENMMNHSSLNFHQNRLRNTWIDKADRLGCKIRPAIVWYHNVVVCPAIVYVSFIVFLRSCDG